MKTLKHMLAVSLAVLLAACGGGGEVDDGANAATGNNNRGNLSEPYSEELLLSSGVTSPNGFVKSKATGRVFDLRQSILSAPTILSENDNVKISVKSTDDLKVIVSPYGYANSFYTLPNPFNFSVFPDVSSASFQNDWIDRSVKSLWASGVNGSGVPVVVLDDFTVDDYSEVKEILFDTNCSTVPIENGFSVYYCPDISGIFYTLTHGQQVTQIISGRMNNIDGAVIYSGRYRYSSASYFDLGVMTQYQKINILFDTPIYGIAFGSNATTRRDDYLTHQRNTSGLFDQLKKWSENTDSVSQGYRKAKVVNLSLGGTSSNPVINKSAFSLQISLANSTVNAPDAIFVKAAGNGSCEISMTTCDPYNAVLYNSSVYKGKSVIVGALNDGFVASYSNKAGSYADRFLVADGRGVQKSDGSYDFGTSFAAPRVAGYAALLRQKYPNLSAVDVADILLSTAKWNNNWGPKNSFTQALYGQGEANVERALNPIGFLP